MSQERKAPSGAPGFTEAQVKAYLADSGRCPECGSEDVEAGRTEFDGDTAWTEVECNDCGCEWHDVYHLHTIYKLDPRGKIIENRKE
jgi:hypothetical protein